MSLRSTTLPLLNVTAFFVRSQKWSTNFSPVLSFTNTRLPLWHPVCGVFIGFFYCPHYFFCDLRDDRVSEALESVDSVLCCGKLNAVHPRGKPIIHSAKSGCNLNPIAPKASFVFIPCITPSLFKRRQLPLTSCAFFIVPPSVSLTLGVGRSTLASTAESFR